MIPKIPSTFSAQTVTSHVTARHNQMRKNRAAIFAAALATAPNPIVTAGQAKAEGSTRLDGPDQQRVAPHKRGDGKDVAEYLRRKPARRPAIPIKAGV